MQKWPWFLLIAASVAPAHAAWAQEPVEETEAKRATVVLDADNIYVNEDENSVIAEGNVEAKYEDRILRADRLTYDRNTDRVRAAGNVVIIDVDGAESFADEIETDSSLSDGYAIGYSTRLPEGGVAVAESAVRTSEGYNALDKIVYTSCELCEEGDTPTWALRARRAVLDQEAQMMSYRDAVLLNSAAALVVADKVSSLPEGVEVGRESIDSGAAKEKVSQLAKLTTEAA